jgi:hypothetical protein
MTLGRPRFLDLATDHGRSQGAELVNYLKRRLVVRSHLLHLMALALMLDAAGSGSLAQDKRAPPAALMPGKSILKGRVVLLGEMPDIEKMNADLVAMVNDKRKQDAPHCLSDKAGLDRLQQVWRINQQNKGVANAVVFLIPEKDTFFACTEDDEAVKKAKDRELKVTQPYCAFHPHVDVLFLEYWDRDHKKHSTGAKLVAYNDTDKADGGGLKFGIFHNVKCSGPPTLNPDSKGVPAGGSITIGDLQASVTGPLSLQCNAHPWMNANIWVLDAPYFGVTDADGKYEIKNAPKGKVRVVAWHEGVPENFMNKNASKGEPIELKDGETTKNFTATR